MTPLRVHDALRKADRSVRSTSSLTGRSLLATLGVWFGLSLVAGVTTTVALRGSLHLGAQSDVRPIVVAEVYAAFVAAAVIVLRARLGASLAVRHMPAWYLLVVCVAWALAYAVTILGHLLLPSLLGPWSATVALLRAVGSDDGRLAYAGRPLMIIILGRACLLAPLGEELLFRGALFSWLRQHASAPWTIVITAAGFALIHGYPQLMLLAFVLGVASGWIRERSGSVIPTVVAHVVHNSVMVVFSYATTDWTSRLPPWGR